MKPTSLKAPLPTRETGRPLEAVLLDIERDRWLSADEAVGYELVARIIERKTELRAA